MDDYQTSLWLHIMEEEKTRGGLKLDSRKLCGILNLGEQL
jgi:hypothetical protein